ncbi:MAG: MerC domain-containing protein [Pyrinomonadaceae bacterium]|nr:MerC domain-containing protein [Pyrinomonadaceae bacterium]
MRLNFQTFNSNGFWDKTGAAVSWLCAVHCLAMPFIISFLPLLGFSFLAHEGIEYVIIGISVVVALLSLLPAYFKQHRKIRTLLLFVSGICFILFADRLFDESLSGKIIFVVIGASLVTSAHFINRRLCRNCQNCADAHCHSFE